MLNLDDTEVTGATLQVLSNCQVSLGWVWPATSYKYSLARQSLARRSTVLTIREDGRVFEIGDNQPEPGDDDRATEPRKTGDPP